MPVWDDTKTLIVTMKHLDVFIRIHMVKHLGVERHKAPLTLDALPFPLLHATILRQPLHLRGVALGVHHGDVIVFAVLLRQLVEEGFDTAYAVQRVKVEKIGVHKSPLVSLS